MLMKPVVQRFMVVHIARVIHQIWVAGQIPSNDSMIIKKIIPTPTLAIGEAGRSILISSIARATSPLTPQDRARIIANFARGFRMVLEPVTECLMVADIFTIIDQVRVPI